MYLKVKYVNSYWLIFMDLLPNFTVRPTTVLRYLFILPRGAYMMLADAVNPQFANDKLGI